MKKLIVCAIALIISCVALAQTRTFDYDVSAFSSIHVDNDFQVTIVNGSGYHAKLTVDEILKEYVVCEVRNNTLTLSFQERNVPADIKKLYKGRGSVAPTFAATVTVPASEGFRHISLSGKSVLRESEIEFTAATVSISATDNAVIRGLNFSGRNISVELSKKASASLALTCDQLDVMVNGASLNLTQKAKNTDLKLQGSANVNLKGETVDMNVTAKGNAEGTISGKAEKVSYNCEGSSKLDASQLVCEEAVITMKSICTLKEAASKRIQLSMQGGSNLFYANDPAIAIDQIKNSSVSRLVK